MSQTVVHVLEVIDVQQQDGKGLAPVALDPVQGMGDAVEKKRAIGQAGQGIVEGVVEELLLGDALLGDIGADAGRSQNASLRVAQYSVVPEDCAAFAAPGDDLRFVMRGDHAAADVGCKVLRSLGALLLREEQLKKIVSKDLVLDETGHLEEVGIAVRHVPNHVEKYRRQLDGVEHLPESALRLAQSFRGPTAFIDVDGHRHTRIASGQTDVVAGNIEGENAAIPGLQIEGTASRWETGRPILRALQVRQSHRQQLVPRVTE